MDRRGEPYDIIVEGYTAWDRPMLGWGADRSMSNYVDGSNLFGTVGRRSIGGWRANLAARRRFRPAEMV